MGRSSLRDIYKSYLIGLFLAVPPIMFGLPLFSWRFFVTRVIPEGHGDFRAFYGAAHILRSGQRFQLYDYAAQKLIQDTYVGKESIALVFNHLSYECLLFLPLAWFNYQHAWMVFLACNLGLLIVAYLVLHPHLFHLVSFGSWVPAALFFTFIPISVALMQGQDSIILLLLITATYGAVRRDRQGVGGFLLGLGLFKFQIVVPIAILFLLWRRWRFVVGFLVSALAALAASVAVVGRDGLVTYFHYLLLISSQSNQFASAVYPSTMANLRGLFFALGISLPFLVIASLAVLAMAARMRPSLEVAIVTACLISYHLNVHDMSILIVPALTSLDQERAQGWLLILAPILILWPGWFCLAALMSLLFLVPELRSRPELATRVSTS